MGIDTDRGFETYVFGNPGFYVWGHEQQVSYDSTGFMRPRGGERGGGGGCLYSCYTIVKIVLPGREAGRGEGTL